MPEPIHQLAAIMFTDIAGYTALMGENSQKALELIHVNKGIQIPLVEQHKGKWVKEIGDGSLSYFSSVLNAVNCAIEIQESARVNLDAKLRIGIHLGDVTIENEDLYGDGVNIASRLESLADPGGIYISDATQKAIRGQSDIETKDLGEIKLKNVTYPVRTFAIQGAGLPTANKKSNWQKLRGSKNYGIIILLITLFLGLTFREIMSFVLIRLNITPVWSEVFLDIILLSLPTIVTILFVPRDKSKFLRVIRKLIPAVNLLAAIITLVFLFWGRDLGAMTTIVTYNDDQGNMDELTVLKNEFVKAVVIYPFELKNADSMNSRSRDDSWLGQGIAFSVDQNMRQYQVIDTWVGRENVSLKEKLEFPADYLVLGNYQSMADSLIVDIKIYNRKAKLFHKQTLTTKTLFEMSDAIKEVLIRNLELHSSVNNHTDLPFTKFITDNERAFRHWVSGNNIAAIKEDSTYAYAYLGELYDAFLYGLGDNYKRQLAEDGLDVMSKLPERDQLEFRAFYFLARGEKDKALRTYERFVEFNPGDPKALGSYIYFLATNGYYDRAFELSRAQFIKKVDPEYGLMMLKLASLVANPKQIEQLEQDVDNVKFLIPDEAYPIVLAQIDMLQRNLASARRNFEDAKLGHPRFYTLDSMINVIEFLEEGDDQKLQDFNASITGTYLKVRGYQNNIIKNDNERLSLIRGGQIPVAVYPIDQNSIYYCSPYFEVQYQERIKFINGEHGQILRFRRTWQRARNKTPFVNDFYKATPELLEALQTFMVGNYEFSDSLFKQSLDYDSGYFFIENYLDVINFSKTESALELPNLLNGKSFISNKNKESYLDFSFNDNVFNVVDQGGLPRIIYPMNNNRIMDSYNKARTYKVSGNKGNLMIEVIYYVIDENRWEKGDTYREIQKHVTENNID